MTKETILNIIQNYIQPLGRGFFGDNKGLTSTVTDLIPDGSGDFQHASQFGFISKPPKKVFAYFLNLFGRSQNPVIINHLHKERPDPGAVGSVLVYSSDASGKSFPVKLYLLPDGTLRIEATSKMKVVCDNIELGDGALEKVLNGESFQTHFNQHTHIDSIGGQTQPPTVPSPASDLSSVVKAKK